MKVFYQIFINKISVYCLLIFLSCTCSQENNTVIFKSHFSESEIFELQSIIDVFESNLIQLYPENNVVESYKSFSNVLWEHVRNSKDISSLYSFKMHNHKAIFDYNVSNEIWIFERTTEDIPTILNLNFNGNYFKYLIELSKTDPFIFEYMNAINNSEDFYSPTVLHGFIEGQKEFNFLNDDIRLVFVIHYISFYN